MTNDFELLKAANSLLRSCFAVILRRGATTNWDALEARVKEGLVTQSERIYGTPSPEAAAATAQTFRVSGEEAKASEEAILAQAKEIERRRTEEFRAKGAAAEERVAALWASKGTPYTLEELRFAAGARCSGCKLGLAYPKDVGFHGSWTCSGILLGNAPKDETKHDAFPFMFYEIKSEDQPSAQGATTRPATMIQG